MSQLMKAAYGETPKTEHVSFEVKDKRGRMIGARITRNTITYSPQDEGKTWGYQTEAGTFPFVIFQATRNGQRYGASQPLKIVKDDAEAEAVIAKYLAAARKRALKV